ncbi:glycosyltransferase [Stieleria marina]|uniref:glycosyltransferase n=1 Tax=Stieleria marina TaxID=1930275 RepID=UPI003AF331D3
MERDLSHVLKIRHLDGYWEKVWSVHPVDIHPEMGSSSSVYGRPINETVSEDHIFVRGRYGRVSWLSWIRHLNAGLALVSLLFHLIGIARHEKIKTIRVGDPILAGLLGLIVARLVGGKLMVRINGDHDAIRKRTGRPIMPRMFPFIRLEEMVEKLVLSRADSILSPGENYQDFAVSKGADPKKCHIVRFGNLIDPRHLAPAGDRPSIEDPKVAEFFSQRPALVHIGRLIEIKHVLDCIEVLGILTTSGLDVGLCFIGDGPLRDTIKDRAVQLGVGDKVMMLGNCDQGVISRIIPQTAVVLSPLTGRALTEAAFGEAAIVAYDLDWQGDLVVDEISGLLVPAFDKQAMADATIRILGDKELAAEFGSNARKRALEILAPAEQTEMEVAAYELMGAET